MATVSGSGTGEGPPGPFELRVSLPCDERFVPTVEALVVLAAKTSGTTSASAEHFAEAVALAVREFRATHAADSQVPVVLRRRAGALEVRVGDRLMTQEP
jgi:hypothetical protein